MNIAVIGAGSIGRILADHLGKLGHQASIARAEQEPRIRRQIASRE